MKERKEIYKVLKAIEDIFTDTIAWAFSESNESGTFSHWNICVSDYNVYKSNDFKTFESDIHELYKSKIKIVFFYCNPLEKALLDLAEKDNLILNMKKEE
jgi:hypothetical protein